MRVCLALVIGFMLGCQGDPQKCEQAVRNYTSLLYWEAADVEIGSAKPEAREALRKQKLAEYNTQLGRGLDTMVSQCQSARNNGMVDCMIAAKTAKQAKACQK
jgi:hypothetical protein